MKIPTFQENPELCEKILLQKPTRLSMFNFLVHPFLRSYYQSQIQQEVRKLCQPKCKSKNDCVGYNKKLVLEPLPKETKLNPDLLIH